MIKKEKLFVMIIILILSVTLLGGCKENPDESTGSTSTAEKSAYTSSGSSTANNNGAGSSTDLEDNTVTEDKGVIQKELAFTYNGKTFAISDTVEDEDLEGLIGEALEKKAHTYSSDDGLNMDPLIGFTERQYKFPGLELKTISTAEGKEFFIFNIKITDPKYSTVRNIKVGDSLNKLQEVYPEGDLVTGEGDAKEDDYRYQPESYDNAIIFHIKDNKVESILIYQLLD